MTYRFGRTGRKRNAAMQQGMTAYLPGDGARFGMLPGTPIDGEPVRRQGRSLEPGMGPVQTYGSLGYASMGIGSMDQAIQQAMKRRYAGQGQPCGTTHDCGPGEFCDSNRCKKPLSAGSSSARSGRRRRRRKRR